MVLEKSWCGSKIALFKPAHDLQGQIKIFLDSEKDFKFLSGKTQDTLERIWQHTHKNFRINVFIFLCSQNSDQGGGNRKGEVPWARPGTGFPLLFEAFSMLFIESEMQAVTKAADIINVYPKRLWKMFSYWVEKTYQTDGQS